MAIEFKLQDNSIKFSMVVKFLVLILISETHSNLLNRFFFWLKVTRFIDPEYITLFYVKH